MFFCCCNFWIIFNKIDECCNIEYYNSIINFLNIIMMTCFEMLDTDNVVKTSQVKQVITTLKGYQTFYEFKTSYFSC